MAATANIVLQGTIIGLPTGGLTINPPASSSSNASGQVTLVVLQAGANTITVPTTPATTGCVIVLPPTNTSVVTLKGVGGDTGVAIGKTSTQWMSWDVTAPPASFVLSSVATQTGLTTTVTFY